MLKPVRVLMTFKEIQKRDLQRERKIIIYYLNKLKIRLPTPEKLKDLNVRFELEKLIKLLENMETNIWNLSSLQTDENNYHKMGEPPLLTYKFRLHRLIERYGTEDEKNELKLLDKKLFEAEAIMKAGGNPNKRVGKAWDLAQEEELEEVESSESESSDSDDDDDDEDESNNDDDDDDDDEEDEDDWSDEDEDEENEEDSEVEDIDVIALSEVRCISI